MTPEDDKARKALDTFATMSEAEPLTEDVEAQLEALAVEVGTAAVASYQAAADEAERRYHLPEALVGAYNSGDHALAVNLAMGALAALPDSERDWNYGNVLFAAHSVLGLLALDAQDPERAIAELHFAGATPGSPQLNSFGPGMQLAKALLRAGHTEPVLHYFEQCRAFWRVGSSALDTWTGVVRAGRVPNFFGQCWR